MSLKNLILIDIYIVFLLNNLCSGYEYSLDVEIDYVKGNKNLKDYKQVPMNVLIFNKYQAVKPAFFSDGPHRGKGLIEPLYIFIIKKIREKNIELYVDYFTVAKSIYYWQNKGYEICSSITNTFIRYQKNIHNHSSTKKTKVSIPFSFLNMVNPFAILTEKLHQISQYKYPGTNIYNTTMILDDKNLYTVQIQGEGNGISELIYENGRIIKEKYKKRIYEFVASNYYQLGLMLIRKKDGLG